MAVEACIVIGAHSERRFGDARNNILARCTEHVIRACAAIGSCDPRNRQPRDRHLVRATDILAVVSAARVGQGCSAIAADQAAVPKAGGESAGRIGRAVVGLGDTGIAQARGQCGRGNAGRCHSNSGAREVVIAGQAVGCACSDGKNCCAAGCDAAGADNVGGVIGQRQGAGV